jgi:hypothetical protein
MLLKEIKESAVNYRKMPTVRFRVPKVQSFEELKNHPDVLKRMGPHTVVFDVSDEERVARTPGENKWNAMRALFGYDEDEIVCARCAPDEWICMAVNVMV